MQGKLESASTRTVEQVVINVPMPFEKAWPVEWEILRGPNKGERGRMGQLLQDRKLDLQDLSYIATHAWNPTTKAAALTLLAHQLGQPQTLQQSSRYGPEVVAGSRYLEKQQWTSEMRVVAFSSIVLVASVTLLITFLSRAVQLIFGEGQPWLVVLIAFVISLSILLVPTGLLAGYFIRREFTKAKDYRIGREGEEWVIDKVRALLDNRWVAFRNVNLPKHKEDIDLVLVGPSGVWALEVKAFNFDVRVQDHVWERLNGKRWQSLRSDPVAQARLNAMHLRYFVERQGIMLRVNAAIILTQPQQVSNIGPTAEPVWKQFEVDEELLQMNTLPTSLSEQDKARIVAALKEVAGRK